MSLGHGAKIVRDGLVLHLDAANPKSYTSGTEWRDLTSNAYNCTLINEPTSSGGSITTDGTNDYILTPRIIGTGTSSLSQSYCLWVRPNGTAGNILSMSSVNPQGSWNMPPIAATASRFRGKFWQNQYLNALSTYTIGVWYYVSLVFYYDVLQANRYQTLYVNGVFQAQQTNITYSSSNTNNFIFLGQQNPGADNTGMFAGDYGIVQIYTNKALTETEIKQNFEATRGRYGV